LGDATTQGTLQLASAFNLDAARTITLAAGGGVVDTNGFDSTISQVISGVGGLTKAGIGTLTLTGASTYSGATLVNGGTLLVNGSITSAVAVASGARLGGNGTVGAVSVASGGEIAPGNSVSPGNSSATLHINGDLNLVDGSTAMMDVSGASAGQIAVNGAASLGGILTINQAGGSYTTGSDYKLITANSVNGVFSSVTGASFTGLDANIVYSAAAVDLKLSSGNGTVSNSFLFGTYGVTTNQAAVGNALAAGANTGALYIAASNQVATNRVGVPGMLAQLSGDLHASLRSAAIEDSRVLRDIVLGHLDRQSDGPQVWGTAFGGYGSIATDGNAVGVHHDSAGIVAGADMPVGEGIRLGLAGAYTSNTARTTDSSSHASGSSGHALAYVGWNSGAVDLKLGGDFGWGNIDVTRTIAVLSQSLADNQEQQLGQIFFQGGYRIETDLARVEPYAGIAHVAALTGAFSEHGDSAALTGGSSTDSQTFTSLGVRGALFGDALGGSSLTPWVDISWQHAFGRPLPGQVVSLQSVGQSFTVLGAPLNIDTAAVQAGLDFAITPDVKLNVGYDGSFGDRAQSNAIRGDLNWKF
jgi:outer membrane autotransporter protein